MVKEKKMSLGIRNIGGKSSLVRGLAPQWKPIMRMNGLCAAGVWVMIFTCWKTHFTAAGSSVSFLYILFFFVCVEKMSLHVHLSCSYVHVQV